MAEDKKRLIIIDGNSVIHRAYHALPRLSTKDGVLVNAVYGFLLVFLKAVKEFNPDCIVAVFDFPAPTFRHKKFEQYKAKRPPAPKELYEQIPMVKRFLDVFNVAFYEKEGFEADDLLGTVSLQFVRKQAFPPAEVIIISGDNDVLQLVDKSTKAYILSKGIKDTVLYDEALVKEKYEGLEPFQLDDYKGLRGDPSDNIPGVRGVGEKTAIDLMKKFGSLDNIYSAISQGNWKGKIPEGTKKILEEHKEEAFFSKALAGISRDVPIDFNLKDCQWKEYNKEKVVNMLNEYEFFSLISRLPSPGASVKEASKENLKLW